MDSISIELVCQSDDGVDLVVVRGVGRPIDCMEKAYWTFCSWSRFRGSQDKRCAVGLGILALYSKSLVGKFEVDRRCVENGEFKSTS